jgi:8-oxo-dGTP pyrophosphatase MutT (NUDIX family)
MATETSAGAVVFFRGAQAEYLLLRSTFWGFPKGRIEPGEDARAAALREVREETGLAVDLVKNFRHVERYTYERRGAQQRKRVIYFLGKARAKDARLSREHTELSWLPYDDALARLEFAGLRETLRAANEFLTKGER